MALPATGPKYVPPRPTYPPIGGGQQNPMHMMMQFMMKMMMMMMSQFQQGGGGHHQYNQFQQPGGYGSPQPSPFNYFGGGGFFA